MTAKEFLQSMTRFLNKKATAKVQVTFGFRFSGDEPGEYTLAIDRGECHFSEGISQKPSVTIECPSDVWVAIANGSMTASQARKSGQFRVRGKFWKMFQFENYFSGEPDFCDVEEGLYVWTENETEIREGRWTSPKRVLGIQASPRKKQGATEWLYSHLIDGISEAGATVDTVYLAERKFEFCRGCYTCWMQTQGECIHRDDFSELIPTIPDYDLIILAVPLYVDGLPGMLKSFLDRWIVLGHPTIVNKEGRCRHPSRFKRMPNLVLASVCGFWELESFDPLVTHMKAVGNNAHMPLIASLLRPAAMSFIAGDTMKGWKERIGAATKDAGMEIVRMGRVSPPLLDSISKPVMTRGQFISGANGWWLNLRSKG